MTHAIATIPEAIEDIRNGRMVILIDDEDRENEGDLVIAADHVTPQAINFMAVEARGLICVSLPSEAVDRIGLAPMARHNRAPLGTAFTVSCDAADVRGTGISASERAHTVTVLMREDCSLDHLRTPGQTFPLRARPGGVLVRAGQTEGSVDLARLAGLRPGAVICEIMNPDGTMARLPELLTFGQRHGIKVVSVADLIAYRLRNECFVRAVADVPLPTAYGRFRAVAFENDLDTHVHLALVMGTPSPDVPALVRVHRADLVADVFGFTPGRAKGRLEWSLKRIAEEGNGVLLYLRTGANGEMAVDGLRTFLSPPGTAASQPASPPAMDFREFGVGAQILSSLGLKRIQVMTNNPQPFHGLSGFGLEIVAWVPVG